MRTILSTILFISLAGCGVKDNNSRLNEHPMNEPFRKEIDLKKAIIYKGDTSAYYELSTAYLDNNFQQEILFYSIIMANHYNYPQAYFDVYFWLTQLYANDISQIDEKTASIAIDYLLEASKREHQQAKEIVEEYSITSEENGKKQIEQIVHREKQNN